MIYALYHSVWYILCGAFLQTIIPLPSLRWCHWWSAMDEYCEALVCYLLALPFVDPCGPHEKMAHHHPLTCLASSLTTYSNINLKYRMIAFSRLKVIDFHACNGLIEVWGFLSFVCARVKMHVWSIHLHSSLAPFLLGGNVNISVNFRARRNFYKMKMLSALRFVPSISFDIRLEWLMYVSNVAPVT